MKKDAIGMLGGMGPESTAYTYMRMISYCQRRYGARLDSDFPPILVYSMPVPDVVEEGSDDAEILSLLEAGISRLEAAGASFSFIACNTMQGFVPALRKRYRMLSLVEETADCAKRSGIIRWGLLGTEVTLRKGYYQGALLESGLEPILPERAEQAEVTRAIPGILAGGGTAAPRSALLSVIGALSGRGAGGIILACTDLPIALQGCDAGLPILDTADISARAAVERWRSRRKPEGKSPF
jgi:aspartate racemase